MSAPTTEAVPERAHEELVRLDSALAAQVEEERLGSTLDTDALTRSATTLAELLGQLHTMERDASVWSETDPALVPGLSVAREHLRLAGRSCERAQVATDNLHEMLHLLRDAVFHADRFLEETEALEDDALQVTRVVSREENRREFMAG